MIKIAACVRKFTICVVLFIGMALSGQDGFCMPSDESGMETTENTEPMAAVKAYQPRYNMWNNYAGALYLSGGFSKEFKYESAVGGKLILDYLVSDKVSVGLQSGLYKQSKKDGGAKTPYLGMRLSYHFLDAGWRPRQNHWNIYAGVSLEIEAGGGEKDWHEKSLVGDLHLGARYRLSERWFVWSEAAINNVSFGLTFAL